MAEPLISVIIPVFNAERYLAACLDSVLSQSYRNIEVIVIDDGSSDFSLKILDSYAEKDDRVKVYTQSNQGQSEARNHGLNVATGEFISFVDADDKLLPDALEILMSALQKNDVDIVEGKFIYGESDLPYHFKGKIEIDILSPEEAIQRVLYQKDMLPSVSGKLFKTYLFEGIRFTKGLIYEDLDIFYKVFERSRKIAYINRPVYFYRNNILSTINTWNSRRLDVLRVTENIENYIAQKYPDILPAAKNRRLSANFNMFALCSIHGDKENASKCWSHIRDNRMRSLFNSKVRFKNKAGIILSYFGKNIFKTFAKRIYEGR